MSLLTSYWISFPVNEHFPLGFGVTAYSPEDALALLEAAGYDFHKRAQKIDMRPGAVPSEIDAKHVAPNSGPHVVRGVWYPCYNIGFGAPGRAS